MRDGLLAWGFGLLLGMGASSLLAAEATRTATPVPRLTGGFGRPRTTPAAAPAASAGGQSLADVVHAAAQSRSDTPPEKGALTISNRSLVKSSEKGNGSTGKRPSPEPSSKRDAAAQAPLASPPTSSASSGDAPAPVTAGPEGGGEAQWREMAARARKRVVDDKARVSELDATAKKLENDFYAWDDGQYRDRVIKPAWDRARSELETARRELADAEKDLADLPEKARRAGALPGWIRE